MKIKKSISFIALATLMLLVLDIVPHHHHEGIACMIMEFCESDDAINDEHIHHHDNGAIPHGTLCVAESDFIVPQTQHDLKCKASSCMHHNHNSLFPVLFAAFDYLSDDISAKVSAQWEYGEHICFYTFADASSIYGLRAPPLC
jgi:hypothetical protein